MNENTRVENRQDQDTGILELNEDISGYVLSPDEYVRRDFVAYGEIQINAMIVSVRAAVVANEYEELVPDFSLSLSITAPHPEDWELVRPYTDYQEIYTTDPAEYLSLPALFARVAEQLEIAVRDRWIDGEVA